MSEIEPTMENLQDPYVLQLIETIAKMEDDLEDRERDAFLAGWDHAYHARVRVDIPKDRMTAYSYWLRSKGT